MTTFARIGAASLALLVPVTAAISQTDQRLLQRGFRQGPHWADTSDEPTFINGGHTKGSDEDIDLFYWDSVGRIKFERENRSPNFWLGYRALTITIDGDIPQITGDLVDVSVAGAFQLNDGGSSDEWRVDLALGAGTANDGHWSNTDALYGVGTINAAKALSEESVLNIGVNYNGNRTIWPDIPLPYVSVFTQVNSDLSYNVGFLSSGLMWQLDDNAAAVWLDYVTATSFTIGGSIGISKEWSTFIEYKDTNDGFYLNDQNNERLFYEKSQVALGVEWKRGTAWNIRLGGGYAFDQRFASGFDTWDTDGVIDPSDEPMFFLTVRGTF
jgi:hypothetical protein